MLFFILFFQNFLFAEMSSESFILQIKDRSILVLSPEKKRNLFAVIVENQSLTSQVGKFMVGGKNIQFVTVPSGKSQTVEIENKSNENIVFVPLSPAFQEVLLKFDKKAYEVPSKE